MNELKQIRFSGSCNFVQDEDNVKVRDERTKTLVMPLQNGTQKDLGLGPDFRRDDEEVKPQN